MRAFVCLAMALAGTSLIQAQSTGSIQGTVVDPRGQAAAGISVAISNSDKVVRTLITSAEGKFAVQNLAPGAYTVEVSGTGFATEHRRAVVAAGLAAEVSVHLTLASVSEEVTVEAEADTSIASQLSPVKAVLDAGSARTEITSQYVNEFTSPVTDFSDIIQAAPGTVSWSNNGIGNGQAKIYFRGFVDDDYTMT
jgi:iron complex outermembrane receptor protein